MVSRIVGGAILLLSLLVGQALSDQDIPLKAALGDEVFQRCGLDRLDPGQLELLAAHFAPPRSGDFVAQAAVTYLEREGWRVIELHAAYRENPESPISDIRHLAAMPPEVLVLETSRSSEVPLPPGAYLAKVASFSLEILDPHGEARRYSIEDRF